MKEEGNEYESLLISSKTKETQLFVCVDVDYSYCGDPLYYGDKIQVCVNVLKKIMKYKPVCVCVCVFIAHIVGTRFPYGDKMHVPTM